MRGIVATALTAVMGTMALIGLKDPAVAAFQTCYTEKNADYAGLTTETIRAGIQGTDFIDSAETEVDDVAAGNRPFRADGLSFHTPGRIRVDYTSSSECAHTRWFQTEGFIQGFRLFEGEENRNGAANISPRIEAFVSPAGFVGGAQNNWTYFWEGNFQIIDGQLGALFQMKQASNLDWVVHLRMDEKKNIYFLKRQYNSSTGRYVTQKIAIGNVGSRPFRVRATYLNRNWAMVVTLPNGATHTVSGLSDWNREPTALNQFRWGIYHDGYDGITFGNKTPSANSRVLVAGARYGRFM